MVQDHNDGHVKLRNKKPNSKCETLSFLNYYMNPDIRHLLWCELDLNWSAILQCA